MPFKNSPNFGLLFDFGILLCAVFPVYGPFHKRSQNHTFINMNQYKLNVQSREQTGRGPMRRLRASGRIPAAVFGKGSSRPISVSAVEFRDLNREIGGEAALVELSDEKGETHLVLIQNVERHAIRSSINHIDFHEVKRGESFVAHVPIQVSNEADSVGVKVDGGMIEIHLHEVEIRCRPSKLPENVEVNVLELNAGEAVHVRDLPAIDGVEYLGNEETVVVSCTPAKKAAEEAEVAPAEGGAAVEEAPAAEEASADDAKADA